MDSRLNKLGTLLESRNRSIRSEAIKTLIQLAKTQQNIEIDRKLFSIIAKSSHSQTWEGRVAAAELLAALILNATELFDEYLNESSSSSKNDIEECVQQIDALDLNDLLDNYQALVSCQDGTNECSSTSTTFSKLTNEQKHKQRVLVDQHLEMNSATGVTSKSFVTDEDLSGSYGSSNNLSNNSNGHKSTKSISQMEFDTNFLDKFIPIDQSSSSNENQTNKQQHFQKFRYHFIKEFIFSSGPFVDLVNQKWHIRHGAALSLVQICIFSRKWLFRIPRAVSTLAIRLIQVLCLDRFYDFMTGSSAIAPVREASAQALSGLILKIHEEGDNEFRHLISAILNKISQMLKMRKHWQCQQTALLLAKYHFATCKFELKIERQLFQESLHILETDSVDEVISSASQALCSLLNNNRLDAIKNSLINEVVLRIWPILECPKRLAQLREGVDAILIDFLTLLGLLFQSNPTELEATLNGIRLNLLVDLLECSSQHCPTTRLDKLLQCFCAIMQNNCWTDESCGNIWSEKLLFQFLKQLYRCVLFCPPSSARSIIPMCQKTLELLLQFCQRLNIQNNLLSADLILSIGLWISCLLYDHKKPEIDVFMHKIDSRQDSFKKEIICGEEIHFLNPTEIDETILERKYMAAKWLAPLIDCLFRSDRQIAQQPMFISVQLLFIPYLRSNSLYQKLGAALFAQAWAQYSYSMVEQKNQMKLEDNLKEANGFGPIPYILAKELEQQLSNTASNKLYDEVAVLVNSLSKECNEFQQYCVRKGVPREELVHLNQANSMEDIVFSSFQNCEGRLRKAEDKQALTARHSNVMELIQRTKLGVKTYTNRVNALMSSAIFHFSHLIPLPIQLTPLIKPLMEALELENNSLLAEELLTNAFVSLFEQTGQREPCPHAKILKQLSTGLSQCENYSPKPTNWTNENSKYSILTMNLLESAPKKATKAKNCELVLRKICHKFGNSLNEKCPEILQGQCASLEESGEGKNIEPFLIRLNYFRTIFPAISNSNVRLALINEKIKPKIGKLMELLMNENPAIRFRIAQFIADIAAIHLCSMLKLIYKPLNNMISGELSSSEFARCGAVELLIRIALIGDKLLGLVALFGQLALRTISDNIEEIRNGAAFAFRQLVILLPIENKQKHFLKELAECDVPELSLAYQNSFSLIDVLTSPGNLPKLRQEEIPGLKKDISLRGYQLEGITWLTFLHQFGLNGILADDMGLGKTLQVLSLLSWQYGRQQHSQSHSPTLVVCPRTLVDHWCKEWNSYFPNNEQILIIKLSNWKEKTMKNGGKFILVISYEELRGNRKLIELHWNYVILDEGHCVRNPNSQLFEVVCALRCAHRLILSGTPVQNSPADLWALFTFLMPGYLLTRSQFQSKYMRQIMACRNPKANEQQIKDGEKALQLLHKQCLPFVMRRQVLTELPEKQIQDRLCELSQLQRLMYQIVVEHCSLAKEKSVAIDETHKEKASSFTPLQALHILRRLVDHPSLVLDQITKTVGQKTQKLLAQNGLYEKPLSPEQSGKIRALRELLAECQIGGNESGGSGLICSEIGNKKRNKKEQREEEQLEEKEAAVNDLLSDPPISPHRALIFCQWRCVVELLTNLLDAGFFGTGIRYLRLDGSIPPGDRQTIVDRFNADTSISLMLLTTQIGGVGLNLTGADVVIFMDHDWNPFRDLQAIDRAHRLGQQKTVNVYRLISQGTVEEKVMRLQRFKADTANALVGADNRSLISMASDELLELFALGDGMAADRPKAAKKAKLSLGEETATTNLDSLWGNSVEEEDGMDDQMEQYTEQHSIQSFLKKSEKL